MPRRCLSLTLRRPSVVPAWSRELPLPAPRPHSRHPVRWDPRTTPRYESSLSSRSDAGKWNDEFISITTLPISHSSKSFFFLSEFPMTKISLSEAIIFNQSNARLRST